LNHTVEEIIENAENAPRDSKRLFFLIEKVKIKLFLQKSDATENFFMPQKHTLDKILKKHPFMFLALHGGAGEDGTIQKILEKNKIKYNGSDSSTSKLCMDKWLTNEIISQANFKGITTAPHVLLKAKDISKLSLEKTKEACWQMLLKTLGGKTIIAKPRGDGCTAGVVRLFNQKDLATYISLIKKGVTIAGPHTFTNQMNTIDMPEGEIPDIIFETFIETDKLKISGDKITHIRKSGYVEMTVGVIEDGSRLKSLSPSITVAEDTILSVEEKFQGGTGVNITPPPAEIISRKNLNKVKRSVELVAQKLDIRGYARIDIFTQIKTGNIIVIEINTLPGLTPSTVIFHQALAEKEQMFPKKFLELIAGNKK
jgi:D-alanine-D-alanine ligase-like ATP-grasp enzyme